MESISTATPEKSSKPDQVNDIENKRYFIDTEWFLQQERSLAVVVRSRMCPSCQAAQVRDDARLDTVKRCCSQAADFVMPGQPLQESAFRLLLANGGQPLSLADMLKELKRRSGASSLLVSARVLDRVLSRDTFYGIRPAAAEPADSEASA